MSLGRLCSGEWRTAGCSVVFMVSICDATRWEDQVRSVRREYAAIPLLDLECLLVSYIPLAKTIGIVPGGAEAALCLEGGMLL